jgi:hypothetical protein
VGDKEAGSYSMSLHRQSATSGHVTWLIAREDFIEFGHCKSYRSYII